MKNAFVGFTLSALLFTHGSSATAQQQAKLRRVGYLAAARGPSPFFEAFKQGELGYVEGQNLTSITELPKIGTR